MNKQYYVYIMANIARTLYVGVTNDLERRVYEHKMKLVPGFTSKYGLTSLVYFEVTEDIEAAIMREKQIKGWLRSKKVTLIETMNPEWKDLSAEWLDCHSEEASHNVILRSETTKNPFLAKMVTDPSQSLP